MYEGLIVVLAIAVLAGIGGPLAYVADKRNVVVLSLPLGFAASSILVTVLYLSGLPISIIRWMLILAACGGAFISFWHKITYNLVAERSAIYTYAIILILLAIPAFVGGVQFTVFQGNIYDHFSYLAGSVVYSNYSYHDLLSLSGDQILKDPLVSIALENLSSRPTVFFLFSLFLFSSKAGFSILSYLFLVLLLSLTYPSLLYLTRVGINMVPGRIASGRWGSIVIAFIPAAFPLGFWGQYVYDINAWSQIASTCLLVLYVAFAATLVSDVVDKGFSDSRRLVLGTVIVLCGAVLIYPESTIIHVAAVMFGCLILRIKGIIRNKAILWLGLVLTIGLLGSFINYRGVVLFLYKQLVFGAASGPDWWVYFHKFLFGRDNFIDYVSQQIQYVIGTGQGEKVAMEYLSLHWAEPALLMRLIAAPINLFLGISGLYFLTPPHVDKMSLFLLWLMIDLLIVFMIIQLLKTASVLVRKHAGEPRYFFLKYTLFFFFIVIGLLALKSQFWSAGKALSFLSAYIVIALSLPLVTICLSKSFPSGFWSWVVHPGIFAFLYVAFAIYLSLYRIDSVYSNKDGIHYSSPYPSIEKKDNKRAVRWKIDANRLSSCRAIEIDVREPFQQFYASLISKYIGKQYFYEFPVSKYYGLGADIGATQNLAADCRIYQSNNNGVVCFQIEPQ
jgi:hypothetical protein